MKILDRHIRGALLGMCLIVALALTGISGFITLVEELDDLGQGQYSLDQVALVTLLSLPQLLYELSPLIGLLGAILGLGALAAGGELVVMQAAGISVLRIAWSAAKTGVVLGLVTLILGEFVVPAAKAQAEHIESRARFGEERGGSGEVWLRKGDRYIRIGALPEARRAEAVQTLTVNRNDSRLVRIATMDSAEYRSGQWRAENLLVTELGYGRVRQQFSEEAEWVVDLSPEVLRLFVLKSDSLSLQGLVQYIRYLKANGLDATAPNYALWRKLAAPLTVVVMILLAVPFVLGSLRDSGAGQRLFIGVMLGIGFYVLNEVATSLGQVYGWPAPLSSLSPTVAMGLLAGARLALAGRR